MNKYISIFIFIFMYSCSESFHEQVTERHPDGNKKKVIKFQGTGTNEKMVEKIFYDINGNIIAFQDLLKNINIKTIFNKNNQKIKKISLKNNKPDGLWEYYDNKEEIIGTIDFNNKKISKIKGQKANEFKKLVLGEWLLESAENEALGSIIDYSENQSDFSMKRIFFEDKILDQWKMDINGQTWKNAGIDKNKCVDIFGEDICLDNTTYHNSILFNIEYPTIVSEMDIHIIKGDTSKVQFYNIYNDEQITNSLKEELIEFELNLINDSTLIIKSWSSGANTVLKYTYKKAYSF